jgi:hypothetical protein
MHSVREIESNFSCLIFPLGLSQARLEQHLVASFRMQESPAFRHDWACRLLFPLESWVLVMENAEDLLAWKFAFYPQRRRRNTLRLLMTLFNHRLVIA